MVVLNSFGKQSPACSLCSLSLFPSAHLFIYPYSNRFFRTSVSPAVLNSSVLTSLNFNQRVERKQSLVPSTCKYSQELCLFKSLLILTQLCCCRWFFSGILLNPREFLFCTLFTFRTEVKPISCVENAGSSNLLFELHVSVHKPSHFVIFIKHRVDSRLRCSSLFILDACSFLIDRPWILHCLGSLFLLHYLPNSLVEMLARFQNAGCPLSLSLSSDRHYLLCGLNCFRISFHSVYFIRIVFRFNIVIPVIDPSKSISVIDPSMPERRVFIIRHGERCDFAFGKSGLWMNSFDSRGRWVTVWRKKKSSENHLSSSYRPLDINLPRTLPKRPDGWQGFAADTPLTEIGYLQSKLTGKSLNSFLSEIHFQTLQAELYGTTTLKSITYSARLLSDAFKPQLACSKEWVCECKSYIKHILINTFRSWQTLAILSRTGIVRMDGMGQIRKTVLDSAEGFEENW